MSYLTCGKHNTRMNEPIVDCLQTFINTLPHYASLWDFDHRTLTHVHVCMHRVGIFLRDRSWFTAMGMVGILLKKLCT